METIFKRIERYRDEIIRFQTDLVSRVALGPANNGTGEHEKAEYLTKRLKELQPDFFDEVRAPDKRAAEGYRPNLIAKWEGNHRLPMVWVLSHMDIVPPGDLSLWEGDPYRARVEENRIIGRGVEDNHHGIVSSYLGLKAILESGEILARPVGLALVADEETGSEFGLEYLLEHRRELFGIHDLIIVPDGGNHNGTMIEIAEKSMLWIKFMVEGIQCHASTPEKGKNSLFGAARLIVDLEKLKEEFHLADELFSPPVSTFESTKIEANVPNINTIPGKDTFYMDCRILPVYEVGDVMNSVKKIIRNIEKSLDLNIRMEPVYRQEAVNPTPEDAPVVQALTGAVKSVKGLDAQPMGIGGGTVAAFFRQVGLPAAVWITSQDTAHQPDEYCLIDDIISDAKVFASIYMDKSVE